MQVINYADMVSAAMKSQKDAEIWYEYLAKLSKFRTRQKELMKDLGKKRKGMSNHELAKAVLPILRQEGLCDGLPDYAVNGY